MDELEKYRSAGKWTDDGKYTFDDWLKDRFILIKNIVGDTVLNDSEKYRFFCDDKMDIETLNKIQKAQKETYNILVQKSLKDLKSWFKREYRETEDKEEFIEKEKAGMAKNFKIGKEYYNSIVSASIVNSGANFITAYQYLNKDEGKENVFISTNKYSFNKLDGLQKEFPCKPEWMKLLDTQMIYLSMDVWLRYNKWLEEKKSNTTNED